MRDENGFTGMIKFIHEIINYKVSELINLRQDYFLEFSDKLQISLSRHHLLFFRSQVVIEETA